MKTRRQSSTEERFPPCFPLFGTRREMLSLNLVMMDGDSSLSLSLINYTIFCHTSANDCRVVFPRVLCCKATKTKEKVRSIRETKASRWTPVRKNKQSFVCRKQKQRIGQDKCFRVYNKDYQSASLSPQIYIPKRAFACEFKWYILESSSTPVLEISACAMNIDKWEAIRCQLEGKAVGWMENVNSAWNSSEMRLSAGDKYLHSTMTAVSLKTRMSRKQHKNHEQS